MDISVCYIMNLPGSGKSFSAKELIVFLALSTDDYIQYKYKDSDDWNNLVKLETLVEIQNDGTNIKWRYKGDTTWNTLTSLADLKGEKGLDGSEIELVNDGTYIKWKYKGKEGNYTNLIDVATLKGQDGLAWINLGTVDVSPYCMTYNEGTATEYEKCGYDEYLKLHFSDAEEGNYTFTDNDDYFMWHVKVENAENVNQKYVLIEYWSTEDSIPNYIQSWYDIEKDKWNFKDLRFASWDNLNYYVNNLKEQINSVKNDLDTKYNELKTENEELKARLKKVEWQDLGDVDTDSYCIDDECGEEIFLKYNFLDKEEGNYKYKDSYGVIWHVKTEITNDSFSKRILIQYFNDEAFPFYLNGYYDKNTNEWNFKRMLFATEETYEIALKRIDECEDRIKALEDYIDELKKQNP